MSALQWLYGLRWTVLPPAAGVAMLALSVGALVAAPREVIEGDVQRLLYIHFPSIVAAYLSFAVVFVASVMVLWRRDMRWDAVAHGAATVGVLFTGLTLATGALWGKPVWGVYWTWDARLTSTLVLFLIYCAYLIARSLADALDERAARYAAVFAIIGALDIPLIMMSVRWWRTLHPQPIIVRGLDAPAMPGEMLAVLLIGFAATLLVALWFMVLRIDTERLAQRTASLRAAVDRYEGA
ncbi:MAG: cytochrome c biogenesis protein CcsA [Dehalococcoidia bacterium]